MARILLVTNYHPSEGGVAAWVTKKVIPVLSRMGHNVSHAPMPFEDSNIDLVRKLPKEGVDPKYKNWSIGAEPRRLRMFDAFIGRHMPKKGTLFVVDFHTTSASSASGIWKNGGGKGHYDFGFREFVLGPQRGIKIALIEVRAGYRASHGAVASRLHRAGVKMKESDANYFLNTASIERTKRLGPPIGGLAAEIAGVIDGAVRGNVRRGRVKDGFRVFSVRKIPKLGKGSPFRAKRRVGAPRL